MASEVAASARPPHPGTHYPTDGTEAFHARVAEGLEWCSVLLHAHCEVIAESPTFQRRSVRRFVGVTRDLGSAGTQGHEAHAYVITRRWRRCWDGNAGGEREACHRETEASVHYTTVPRV